MGFSSCKDFVEAWRGYVNNRCGAPASTIMPGRFQKLFQIHIRKKPTSQQTSLPTRSCRGGPTCVDLFIPTKQEAHSPWGGSAGKQTMVGRWGGVGHCLKYFEKKNKTTKSLAGFCYHHVPAVLNNVSDKNTPMWTGIFFWPRWQTTAVVTVSLIYT